MYSILFIDDDIELLTAAKQYFTNHDFKITTVENAKKAIHLFKGTAFDCIILDIKLPDMDGFEVCKIARQYTNAPIIILSSYVEYQKRITGLTIGADDYVCKPFSFEELRLRINLRIHKRYEQMPATVLTFDLLTIDTGKQMIFYGTKSERLSTIQFEILLLLASQPERIFSYEQIYDAIWKEPLNNGRHTLQARVSEVRIKLNSLCDNRPFIQTAHGKGYFFTANP